VLNKMSLIRIGIALLVAVLGVSYWAGRDASSPAKAGSATSATSRANPSTGAPSATPSTTRGEIPVAKAVAVAPLSKGERWVDLTIPGGTYVPQAENGGTDDYRCIVLDPHFTTNEFLTGVVLEPGNADIVHHAILYRADPDQVAAATLRDKQDPRLGWSCFGGPGLPGKGGNLGFLDSAPWVAAFATDGGEQRFASGTGQKLLKGSRLILQMHYNLLNASGADYTQVRLRVAADGARLKQIQTMLLPGPVELPCAAGESGPLCDRTAAVFDVMARFGQQEGAVIGGLQVLCGGNLEHPRAGATQSCTRPVNQPMVIGAVAGHMHMLGKSITIDLLRASGETQRLLDVPVWNFDDQRATRLSSPVTVRPGDRLKVTCTHDASLRQKNPALKKLQPRYVVWGEGSADEMCLGIVSYVT